MGREVKLYSRKAVTYRLNNAQLQALAKAAEATKKTKTKIIEEAIGVYLNQLHLDGVI